MSILYQRSGGQAAVDKVVETFYCKVFMDDRINSFFEDIEMNLQIQKQQAFLTLVFGGPTN